MDYLFLFGELLSFLLLYKYAALFVLVFLSGIGLPIPGSTLMIAVGAFSSQGYFDFSLSLSVAIIANILGDLFDYFLMRKYGISIIKKNYHKKFIAGLEYYVKFLERYINSHQGITIFITRFLGSAGTVVNFLSGLLPVKLRIFIIYDALGNFLNISFMILLGFFISESWQNVAGIVGAVSTIIYVLILIILATMIIKKFNRSKMHG